MILFCTPYRSDKNLGKAYNEIMQLLGDKDCACFTDGDTSFLTPDFGTIIENYTRQYPDAVLTCKTNRIHKLSKQLDGEIDDHCNIKELIIKAAQRKHLTTVTEIMPNEGMSGLLMVVSKKIWAEVPFIENKGCLGVDSQFRIDLHKAGKKIYIMDGVFIFHQYRLLNGAGYKQHLL